MLFKKSHIHVKYLIEHFQAFSIFQGVKLCFTLMSHDHAYLTLRDFEGVVLEGVPKNLRFAGVMGLLPNLDSSSINLALFLH